MIRIALVVNSFPKLSESFIFNKVKFLSDSGYIVTVITHSPVNDNISKENELPRINILLTPASLPIFRRLFHYIRAFFRHPIEFIRVYKHLTLIKLPIKERIRILPLYFPFMKKYEIIHFSFSGLAISYLPLIPLLRQKAITYTSCRGHAEQIRPLTDQLRQKELGLLFSVIDRIHCVSDDILDTCKKYGLNPEKAFVNRPAIDASVFQRKDAGIGNDSATIRLVTVSRLHWKKAQEFLLLTLRSLIDKGINVSLFIAGSGPEREKLSFFIHMLELEDKVTLLGSQSQDQILNLLNNCDIYIHSSISEGISNAVMEAMAMELPVVSTNVGGMGELIDDGIDGLLVPPLQPLIMAEKIAELCQDYDVRRKIGRNARLKILSNFTIERQRNVYLREYYSALAAK